MKMLFLSKKNTAQTTNYKEDRDTETVNNAQRNSTLWWNQIHEGI